MPDREIGAERLCQGNEDRDAGLSVAGKDLREVAGVDLGGLRQSATRNPGIETQMVEISHSRRHNGTAPPSHDRPLTAAFGHAAFNRNALNSHVSGDRL